MVLHSASNSPFINDTSGLCFIKGSILERNGESYNKKDYYERLIRISNETIAEMKKLVGKLLPGWQPPIEPYSKKTYLDENDFRCYLSTFTEFCKETGILFYICIILIFLIIIISVSGKIKENYRWFIFNQAIFDLSLCYYNFCYDTGAYSYGEENRYYYNWCGLPNGLNSVFYQIYGFWAKNMYSNIYLPLFLLSGSRFVCLFFPHFYERTTKGWRLFAWIFGFDFIFAILCLANPIFSVLRGDVNVFKDKEKYGLLITSMNIFDVINYLRAYICLIPSIFFILSVIIKIIKHSKYQFRHNRAHFYSTIRIAAVMILQLLLNLFILSIEITKNGGELINKARDILNIRGAVITDLSSSSFYWLDANWGIGSNKNFEMLKEFRIVLESFIVLIFMTGYREAMINFLKVFIFRKKQVSQTPLHQSTTVVQSINGRNR